MTETPTNNYKNRLVFFVNGQKVEVINPDPRQTLLQYLRKDLRLTGTKLACGEGGCGACTVMVARYSSDTDDVTYFPVNACLAPVCSMHGLAVTTVEGIGSVSTALHPVQSVLAEHHGSQCGFCTPGIVMSMYTLLQSDRQPASSEIQEHFDGNLCRCTGYRPILQAYNTFAAKEECSGTCEFCPKKGIFNDIEDHPCKNSTAAGETQKSFLSQDKKQLINKLDQENLEFCSPSTRWFSPTSLGGLLEIRRKYRDCKLVNGNTEVEIEVKFKKANYQTLVSVTRINQLKQVIRTESGIEIGASLPLSQVKKCFEEDIRQLPEYKTRALTAIVEMLKWFAGHQIRSVACLAGNIMTASPISDLNPLLLACRAMLKYLDLGKWEWLG
ncbi:xanthine dehydrogenase-like [Physella acuta]|uniref:xanthine dehydrogenase-like n=1 Tax=Physella acuta TaxID=109671 RepID=UPI0027DDB751|nr:xanthine dehydrogenase-like [Physella acuta]